MSLAEIEQVAPAHQSASSNIRIVPLALISPSPLNFRTEFDDVGIDESAQSIKEGGLLNAMIVRENPNGEGYELVGGERRYRACLRLGLETVEVKVIKAATEREYIDAAIADNVDRRNLNPIEKANAYRVMRQHNYTDEEIGVRIHVARNDVQRTLSLLELDADVQQDIISGAMSEAVGEGLIMLLNEPTKLDYVVGQVRSGKMHRSDIDRFIKERCERGESGNKAPRKPVWRNKLPEGGGAKLKNAEEIGDAARKMRDLVFTQRRKHPNRALAIVAQQVCSTVPGSDISRILTSEKIEHDNEVIEGIKKWHERPSGWEFLVKQPQNVLLRLIMELPLRSDCADLIRKPERSSKGFERLDWFFDTPDHQPQPQQEAS